MDTGLPRAASADASVSAPNRFRHNEMSSLELRIGSPPAINSYASNHSSPVFAGRQQTHIRVNRLATPRGILALTVCSCVECAWARQSQKCQKIIALFSSIALPERSVIEGLPHSLSARAVAFTGWAATCVTTERAPGDGRPRTPARRDPASFLHFMSRYAASSQTRCGLIVDPRSIRARH